jgi:hypothetical protein
MLPVNRVFYVGMALALARHGALAHGLMCAAATSPLMNNGGFSPQQAAHAGLKARLHS